MSLKNKTVSGVAWNGIGNIIRQGLMIITLIIMARFLTPDDFGVYAILMVFVTFMNIFASMGTSQAVIYLDSPDQRMLSSIFYFNIAIGIVLFVLLYFLAWPVATFFDNPKFVNLLQIVGIAFIISTASLVHKALLEKKMLFKRVVMIESFSLTLSSIAGVIATVYGMGVYSLIIMSLSNAGIMTLALWLNSHWRPSFNFALEDIKTVLAYSLNLTSFSFINYFSRQADQILIGKFIGSGALGVYSLAYRIMLYPLDNVSRIIVRVLFPAFSEVKNDNIRFKNGYLKAIRFIGLVTFPLMFGLMAAADNFVAVVFGDQWSSMVILLIILAPVGLIQSIVTTVGSVFLAKGTTGLMFKIGTLNAIVTVLSFFVGIPFGVEGMAIAYGLANLIMLYPNLKVSWSQIELGVFEGLSKLAPFFLASSLMATAVYFFGRLLINYEFLNVIILVMQVIFGAVFYLIFLLVFYRELLFTLLSELRSRKI